MPATLSLPNPSRSPLNFTQNGLGEVFRSDKVFARETTKGRLRITEQITPGTLCSGGIKYRINRVEGLNDAIDYQLPADSTSIDWKHWGEALWKVFLNCVSLYDPIEDLKSVKRAFETLLSKQQEATRFAPTRLADSWHRQLCEKLKIPDLSFKSRVKRLNLALPDLSAEDSALIDLAHEEERVVRQQLNTDPTFLANVEEVITADLPNFEESCNLFYACRNMRSTDLKTRLVTGRYEDGFLNPPHGFTQGVARKITSDDTTEGFSDIFEVDGQRVGFEIRAFDQHDEAEIDAARQLAHDLFGNGWNKDQKALFAGATDKMWLCLSAVGDVNNDLPSLNEATLRRSPANQQQKSERATEEKKIAIIHAFAREFDIPTTGDARTLKTAVNLAKEKTFEKRQDMKDIMRSSSKVRAYFLDSALKSLRIDMSEVEFEQVKAAFTNTKLTF